MLCKFCRRAKLTQQHKAAFSRNTPNHDGQKKQTCNSEILGYSECVTGLKQKELSSSTSKQFQYI